ncbi:adenosylcobinamide-GDP ribazoletransferase [Thermospira aquatica]|uniref:Adenosylcobinamide-GDP ribazoletransferase n=1 Tax=Thermospira aquatica TaxID=2828656 RepID=A0AAX3BB68_9SPIR|nr:adenosylcobinamide-GDP ribazoletransferase [Thermospira aquatica]URA09345.1 adenosylcobinamide-GDP ribazoletransferase [Thermospira aquatica]
MKNLLGAFSLLTILPLSGKGNMDTGVVLFFPLVGLVYGVVGSGWIVVGTWLGMSPMLVVMGMIVFPWILNGGFHFDGWCDCWDGFGVHGDREKRLEAMKDSRIGAFGMAGGVFLLLFRYSVYPLLLDEWRVIWFSWVLSRSAIVWQAWRATYPKSKGTGAFLVGKISGVQVAVVTVQLMLLGGLTAWLGGGWRVIAAMGSAVLATVFLRGVSNRRIGGVTGDVLGATAELVEALSLLAWIR